MHKRMKKNEIIHPGFILFQHLFKRCLSQRTFQLFLLCIFLSSLLMSCIGFFSKGVQSALNQDISKFLGAPLVITSEQQISESLWKNEKSFSQINATTTASFTYGVSSETGYQTIGLKAVSHNYPKVDNIKIKIDSTHGSSEILATAQKLKPKQAWLDSRALSELALKQGDFIQLGQQNFLITAEIIFEPDRLTQLQHLLPRVMIRMDDLELIGLDINNSRGEFRYLFNENPKVLEQLERLFAGSMQSPYKILKPNQGQHPFSRMAQRSEKMLGLVMLLIMLMCGSAAALVVDKAMKKFVIPTTIFRCLGLNQKTITLTMMMLIISLVIVGSSVGTGVAWLMQPLIQDLLEPLLTISHLSFDIATPLITFFINVLIIVAFIFPRLIAVGSAPIVSVLRNQMHIKSSFWLTTIISFTAVFFLLWHFSDNTKLTILLIVSLGVILIMSLSTGWIMSQLMTQFHRFCRGHLKIIIRSIGRHPQKNLAPMITISFAVMGFLMIDTLRGSFLDTYYVESLNQDGNLIFSRLSSDKKEEFEQYIKNNGLILKGMYPTVSARLKTINGLDIDKALTQESDTRQEARSPVRLSWSKSLPENNRLLEGKWPLTSKHGVSVESEVMSDLGLSLGDKLGFNINGQLIISEITSRREFKSGASRMMFWFMFSPETLKQFDAQFMGGLIVSNNGSIENRKILNELNKQFPQVLFNDLGELIDRVSAIMESIMKVMTAMMLALLIAAFTVLVTSSYVSNQGLELMILRCFGQSKKKILLMNLLQQGLIAMMSCLVGVLGAQIISGVMFDQLFSMPFKNDWLQNVLIIIGTTLSFVVFNIFLSHHNYRKPLLINQLNYNS